MGTLRIQNVCKEFGGQVVLNDVSAEFHTGETVGFVGCNGSGKTTLFRLITGALTPDTGSIAASKGLRIGYLAQDPQIRLDHTLYDEVAGAFAELSRLEHKQRELSEQMAHTPEGPELQELMAEYDRVHARFLAADGYAFETRMNEILGGLGFTPRDYDLPMSALSGGQQCRAALAKLLLEDSTFLLLDEPTNHLDIDAIRWLEKYLAGHHGGAIVVSHDRYLLDRIADRMVELDRGRLTSYKGDYTNYAKTRHLRRLTQQRQYEQDQEFIAKERAFIQKHLGKQRTAEARGRQTRLERRIAEGEFQMESVSREREMRIGFEKSDQPAGWVLEAEGLAKRYDDKTLFEELGLHLHPGQRIGITGPNGTGKTTLLRILLGRVEADAGKALLAPKTNIGYFAQDGGSLNADNTLLEEFMLACPHLTEQQARAQLGRMRFTGDDAFKRVTKLSGGERSRLRLLKLIFETPNVLVLDEPTNHLDIPSREALEDALLEFPGAVLVVSHDRYLLDRIVSHLLVIRPDTHAFYPGNYSYYIEQIEQRQRPASAARSSKPARRRRSPAADRTAPKRKKSPFARNTIEELETMIVERETRIGEIEQAFGNADVCRDAETVTRLRAEFGALQAELAELHAAWEEKIDALDDHK